MQNPIPKCGLNFTRPKARDYIYIGSTLIYEVAAIHANNWYDTRLWVPNLTENHTAFLPSPHPGLPRLSVD